MLRNLGIRAKALVLLAVPLVLLLALAIPVAGHQAGQIRAASRDQQLAATSGNLTALIHHLQAERAATAAWTRAQTKENRAGLLAERHQVDAAVAAHRRGVAQVPIAEVSPAVVEGLTRAAGEHDGLGALRAAVDAAPSTNPAPSDAYDQIVAPYTALPTVLALAAGNDELAATLGGLGHLASVIEASARERDLLATAFASTGITRDTYAAFVGMVATQDDALRSFESFADPEQLRRLRAGLAAADPTDLTALRLRAGDLLTPGPTPPEAQEPREWTEAANGRIDALVAVESSLVSDLQQAAAARVDALRRQAAVVGALAALALALALAAALALTRRVVQPLVTLTRVATQAADDMPAMVERLQHRNAELREDTAKMVVSVARRNQVLLGRQLTLIDAMERDRLDPDDVERLLRLDHLAAQMRRNAESLLVLAGLDSTRRLREGLALSEVIRTAASEIEAHDRVDLDVAEDARLHGRSALSVSHLLAEILDNATHFSNPDTRVGVSARPATGGIEITITDHGLGMGAEELAAANAVITSTPTADVVVSQRLGFLVVGRLAQQLGIAVVVRAGSAYGPESGQNTRAVRSVGTVVTLTLPAALFEAPPLVGDAASAAASYRPDPPPDTLPATSPTTGAPPQSASAPEHTLSSAPAIDILPGDGGARRHRRRSAAGPTGPVTPGDGAPPTRSPVPSVATLPERRVARSDDGPAGPSDELPDTIAAADRPHTASDVSGMLSGFRAGLERGRPTSAARSADTDQ